MAVIGSVVPDFEQAYPDLQRSPSMKSFPFPQLRGDSSQCLTALGRPEDGQRRLAGYLPARRRTEDGDSDGWVLNTERHLASSRLRDQLQMKERPSLGKAVSRHDFSQDLLVVCGWLVAERPRQRDVLLVCLCCQSAGSRCCSLEACRAAGAGRNSDGPWIS